MSSWLPGVVQEGGAAVLETGPRSAMEEPSNDTSSGGGMGRLQGSLRRIYQLSGQPCQGLTLSGTNACSADPVGPTAI